MCSPFPHRRPFPPDRGRKEGNPLEPTFGPPKRDRRPSPYPALADLPKRSFLVKNAFHRVGVSAVIFAISFLLLEGCRRISPPKERARIAVAQVSVKKTQAALSTVVAELQRGDEVEVLSRESHWMHVRTSGGQEGWIEETAALNQTIIEAEEKLTAESKTDAVQADGLLQSAANLHVAPGRDGPVYTRIPKDEKVEVLGRTLTDRPAQTSTSTTSEISPTSPLKRDPWLKVRTQDGTLGWVYSPSVNLAVPDAIASYSESRRIVAWLVLNQVEIEDGKRVNQYVVADLEPGIAPEYDFDRIRVFTWNRKRSRYETAFRENRIHGMYPIRIFSYANKPAFEITELQDVDEPGRKVLKRYFMNGVLVREIGAPPGKQAAPQHRRR